MNYNALLGALWAALLLVSCGNGSESQSLPTPTVRPVLVQRVTAGNATPLTYAGEVRARHEADLAFRVSGKMMARYVSVGDAVERGKILARLDTADLKLNAQAAQAQLGAAESDHTLAKAELERYGALMQKKLITQSLYDAKVSLYQASKAKLEQAQAQRAVLDNQAAYGALTADHAGVITAVLAEAGQVVGAGQPVMKLARPEEQEIVINIPEDHIKDVRRATQMTVTFWARPEVRLSAALRELAPAADMATRTYTARIRLIAPDAAIRLGMTAQVTVQPTVATTGILVPLTAVVDQGHGPAVWVVVNDKVQRRPVDIQQYREDGVVLAGGVQSGELVVTVGAHKLVADQPVRPIVQTTAPSGGRS